MCALDVLYVLPSRIYTVVLLGHKVSVFNDFQQSEQVRKVLIDDPFIFKN